MNASPRPTARRKKNSFKPPHQSNSPCPSKNKKEDHHPRPIIPIPAPELFSNHHHRLLLPSRRAAISHLASAELASASPPKASLRPPPCDAPGYNNLSMNMQRLPFYSTAMPVCMPASVYVEMRIVDAAVGMPITPSVIKSTPQLINAFTPRLLLLMRGRGARIWDK